MPVTRNPLSSDPCAMLNGDGDPYFEFSCVYGVEKFYTEFERTYDPCPILNWMMQNSWVAVLGCAIYGVAIVAGKAYFAKRERLHWRYTLAAWNAFLSLFSLMGMVRTVPQLMHQLAFMSVRDNLCMDPRVTYGSGSTGLWTQLFVLSKFPELFDTFFIIIHKKKLIFLHWYHHITVLLYCWHSYVTTSPHGIFFVTMNFTVHAIMYGYYCLMALRIRPTWFKPVVVTAMQIAQMFVGVAVTLAGFYYYQTDPTCEIGHDNNTAAFIMYGSYLFLFLQFFIGRYVQGPKPPKKTV